MVTTHNSTALKENGITEEIFIKFQAHTRSFLYFAQNYPSSVPRTFFICINTWAKIKLQILLFPSSNGCILIMFQNKFVATMIGSSFLKPHETYKLCLPCIFQYNPLVQKYDSLQIQVTIYIPPQDIFFNLHHCLVCLFDDVVAQSKIWCFFR